VSKKKQQEALQRAQKHVSGNKLTKSEVKTLEQKGFSSKQIQAVAGSMGSVGGSAQSRIDNKHTSSGSGNSGGGGGGGKVQTVGPNARNIKVDGQGRAVVTDGVWNPNAGGQGLIINKQQASKINKKVDNLGGSLVGGQGMAISRYVTVKDPGRDRKPKDGGGRIGGGKQQLAIYAPFAQPGKTKNNPTTSNSGGGSRSSGGGSRSSGSSGSSQGSAQQSAYQRAQDHISARTPEGRPPELRINPGTAVEDVADYTNRLGVFNANYSGWMQDRAEADRYQTGRFLQGFAASLPKAPDVMSAKDMIEMANKMNNKINVG
jgi:hypothetical protein